MHRVRKHGHVSDVATKINTPWCPVCLLFLHSERRVMRHAVQSSRKCGTLIQTTFPVVVANPYQAYLQAQEEGESRDTGPECPLPPSARPAIRAAGPLPRWAHRHRRQQ
eukprot:1417398-Alexandrium_andersonii.AAC.1